MYSVHGQLRSAIAILSRARGTDCYECRSLLSYRLRLCCLPRIMGWASKARSWPLAVWRVLRR